MRNMRSRKMWSKVRSKNYELEKPPSFVDRDNYQTLVETRSGGSVGNIITMFYSTIIDLE